MRKIGIFCVLLFIVSISVAYALDSPAKNLALKTVIWIADSVEKGEVIKLSGDGNKELLRKQGFNMPKDIEIDPRDDSVWVADTYNNRILKLSFDAKKELAKISGFNWPFHIAVDSRDGSCWVADQRNYEVVKLSSDGKELLRITGFSKPHDIEFSSYDNSIWVLDTIAGEVIKLSRQGEILGRLGGFGSLIHFAINPVDGTCWVTQIKEAGRAGSINALIKISSDCKEELGRFVDLGYAPLCEVNPVDGSCWVVGSDWVAGLEGSVLYNISQDCKTQLLKVEGLNHLTSISKIDRLDGSFWVGDVGAEEIIKISAVGKILKRVKGFKNPIDIEVYSSNE